MLRFRYFILRYFYLTAPINERRLRSELRKLNISSEAVRYARALSAP